MRYLPTMTGSTSESFNESQRPALDKLPEKLADKIRERDRIQAQRAAAQHRVRELGTDQMTEAARQADDEAAAKAARGGRAIPAPAALPKLEADRAKAEHAAQAQQAAFVAIDAECDTVASDLWWGNLEKLAGERAAIRAEIAAKAAELADAVEAAVDMYAVADWQRHGVYNTSAKTWPTDVTDLERYGLTRKNTTPINVRDVIIAAATTCLDEPTEK
jgi:hypothetical protein